MIAHQYPPKNMLSENGPWAVTVALVMAMCFAVVSSVVHANWASGLGAAIPVMWGGLLLGALFGRFKWLAGLPAHIFSVILGAVWTVQIVGPQLGAGLPTWRDRAIELLIRVIVAGRLVAQGGQGDDLTLFVAVVALIAWFLAYFSAWLLLRNGFAWWVVLLNAVVLFLNLTYASPKPPAGLFFLYVGAALLIIVQQNYLQRARTWDAAAMEYPDFLGWRFVGWSVAVVLAMLIGSTLLPTRITTAQVAHVWQRVREPWQQVQARWDRTFSTINAPANAVGGGFSSKSFTLGGARTLGTELVMEVKSPRFDYWRATAYDRYDGRLSWPNTTGDIARAVLGRATVEESLTPLAANTTMPQLDADRRTVINQTFILHQGFAAPTLFAATQPISLSIPSLVQHTYLRAAGASVANYSDTTLVQAQSPVRDGLSYTVASSVADADKQTLRAAPVEYAQWLQRYLQLPPTLPKRLRDKVHEIVTDGKAGNPYDKAEAIQNFLRTFPYDEKIPSPPDDRDVVDYFVFDLKRGYCDYFASAMVVMLRTEGIPARIAQGYAGGEWNPETESYVVRQNFAHTWPEVYFPGYGWQRFEPTPASYTRGPERADAPANQQSGANNARGAGRLFGGMLEDQDLQRIERQIAEHDGNAPITPEQMNAAIAKHNEEVHAVRVRTWQTRGGGGLGILLALLAYWWFIGREQGPLPPSAFYRRLLRWARFAGVKTPASATPVEMAGAVARRVPGRRWELETIAAAYTRECYGERTVARDVEPAWKALRKPLLSAMLRRLTGSKAKRG
ncbi:MAG: transglutaminaseTgpA domain-containing protein [Herpetosiphon sp.]